MGYRTLAANGFLGGARGGPGADGQHHPPGNRLGLAAVVQQEILKPDADQAVELGADLGVAEFFLGLALKLGLFQVQAQNGDHSLAGILGVQAEPFGQQVLHIQIVPHGFHNPGFEAVFVGAAKRGGNAVDKGEQPFVGRLGPGQDTLKARIVRALQVKHLGDDGLFVVGAQQGGQIGPQPVLVLIAGGRAADLVVEDQTETLVQVGLGLQPLGNQLGAEANRRKDVGVGVEADRRAAAARTAVGPEPCQLARRPAPRKGLLPFGPATFDAGDQTVGQGGDHRGADPVQTARVRVVQALELAPGVQGGQDEFQGRFLELGMDVNRDAPAVIADRDRRPVLVQPDLDAAGMAVHGLIHGVVEQLPHQVMQAGAVNPADIHAGPFADRLQALQNRDVFGRITMLGCHVRPPQPLRERRPAPSVSPPVAPCPPAGPAECL